MLIPILAISLLLLEISLFIVGLTSFDPWLPKNDLDRYLSLIDSPDQPFFASPAFVVLDSILLLIYWVSLIGVSLRFPFAKFVYLGSVIFSTFYLLWPALHVVSAPMALIEAIHFILTGVLIALVYLPAYKHRASAR